MKGASLPADHGRIQLVVGFHVEPAFEDNFNAVDVILKTYDGACPVSGDPDTHPGDGTSGTYGYHVFGKVHAGQNTVTCPGGTPQTLAARTATIDTYFVCGAGSLVPPDSFDCVTAVQPFPGQPEDEYKANRTSGVDR